MYCSDINQSRKMYSINNNSGQVSAQEALQSKHLSVAKEALQQLHKLIASNDQAYPKGREAVVLRNLVKVTMDTTEAEGKPVTEELADLFGTCASKAQEQGIAVFFQDAHDRQATCLSLST